MHYLLPELMLFAFFRAQVRPFLFGRKNELRAKSGDCFQAWRSTQMHHVCGTSLREGQVILWDVSNHAIVSKNASLLAVSLLLILGFIGWIFYAF